MRRTWTDDQLITAHLNARSMRALLSALGLVINGSNNRSIKKHLARLGLDIPRVVVTSNAEKSRRYRERHPGYAQAATKKHQQENPEKWAAYARNRRAKKHAAEGSFTAEEFSVLCSQYGDRCLCCGSSDVTLTADHIKPLSKGGANTLDNIQPLCGHCNSRKHTKTIDYRSAT